MDTHVDPAVAAPLSINLTMTPGVAAELRRCSGVLDVARSYVVDSPDMANLVNIELKETKGRIVKLKELKAGFTAPAKTIVANAEALFDGPIAENIQVEAHYKKLLTDWTTDQQRLADEARRKAEAEERRLRQEAEQKAAAERARAEEQAREQHRIAREAEERRATAEKEGNARAAAAAAAEAAKATEKAAAVVENGESKAQEAILTAAAAPAQTVIPAAQKIDGFSTRDNWIAELAAGKTEEGVVVEIARALTDGRGDLAALLKLDMSAANKLAKALKKSMNVPGLWAVNRPVAASRK